MLSYCVVKSKQWRRLRIRGIPFSFLLLIRYGRRHPLFLNRITIQQMVQLTSSTKRGHVVMFDKWFSNCQNITYPV